MAKRKTTELTTITAASLAAGDWFPVVDVSDTTDSPTGTNKKIAKSELAEAAGLTAHLADTDDAHDASAISVLDSAGIYTATNVESVLAELPSRYAPLVSVQGQPGIRWAFFGDSITNGSSASNFAYSFMPQALQMVGSMIGRYDSIEAGTSGETSAQVLARMSTTYSSYTDVRGTVLLVGANDAGNSVTVATFAANLTSMIALARRYGPVVVCTVPPRGSGATAGVITLVESYNWWIKAYAPGLGAIVADVWSALVDTTAGTMLSTYNSGDDVHPNNDGHREMAQVVAKAMQSASTLVTPYGMLTSRLATTKLLTTDPLVVGGTTKPASWFEQPGGTGSTPTYSLVSDTSGFLPAGRWSQVDFDASSGGTRYHACAINSNWSVGDVLALCAHIQIEDVSGTWESDVSAGTCTVTPLISNQSGVAITGGIALTRCAGIPTSTSGVYNIGPIFWPVTVPAGTTSMAMWMGCTVATGKRIKFRFGCVGVVNLTAMGLASQFGWATAPINT